MLATEKVTTPNSADGLFRTPGLNVEIRDVHKSYHVADEIYAALRGVSCAIPAGKVTTIQGPSGCGKSTLLNTLSGVDYPTQGTVKVGENIIDRNRSERELADYRLHEVGFIFQAFNLIPGLTALGNLELPMTVAGLPRRERQDRGSALLDLVRMSQKAEKRPDSLSGGEQQRVAIALALANDPALILADEPTGNLDSTNAKNVIDLLWALAHQYGKTVVITTHDQVVADRGDQILHMRDGQFEHHH
jgi:putative ABC transport system ATP-binding protein